MAFSLKREIDLGQLLTVVSIVGSLVAFLITSQRDSDLRDKEYADRVRKSASVVTAKVERWGELADRYFEDLQPTLVDVSEKVAETNAQQPANRILFKGLMDAKGKASQRIVDEQLQIAYMELYGYAPGFQAIFDRTIGEIRSAVSQSQDTTREHLQAALLHPQVLAFKTSPQVGFVLRKLVEDERSRLRARIASISAPLRSKMLEVIRLTDSDLRDVHTGESVKRIFGSSPAASAPPR